MPAHLRLAKQNAVGGLGCERDAAHARGLRAVSLPVALDPRVERLDFLANLFQWHAEKFLPVVDLVDLLEHKVFVESLFEA